jgi:hypothetical protein
LLASALVLLATGASATPAFAARRGSVNDDRRISISGDIDVARGEVVHGPVVTLQGDIDIRGHVTSYVVVGDGDLTVSGRVTDGVVVVHGDARISGHVGGDVVAVTGRVIVTSTGSVDGDVVSRRDAIVARGTVGGEVRGLNPESILTHAIVYFLLYLWLSVTISTAVLGLLFVWLLPRAADTAVAAGRRVSASIGWGALVGIVGPMVAVLVFVSVLGLPLGFTMLSALNVLAPLGYVTAALILGRMFVKAPTDRARIGAFFAGFAILRLLALIPGVGLIVWFCACVYGIGAVSMAAWYGGHLVRDRPDEPAGVADTSAGDTAATADDTAPPEPSGVTSRGEDPLSWRHDD